MKAIRLYCLSLAPKPSKKIILDTYLRKYKSPAITVESGLSRLCKDILKDEEKDVINIFKIIIEEVKHYRPLTDEEVYAEKLKKLLDIEFPTYDYVRSIDPDLCDEYYKAINNLEKTQDNMPWLIDPVVIDPISKVYKPSKRRIQKIIDLIDLYSSFDTQLYATYFKSKKRSVNMITSNNIPVADVEVQCNNGRPRLVYKLRTSTGYKYKALPRSERKHILENVSIQSKINECKGKLKRKLKSRYKLSDYTNAQREACREDLIQSLGNVWENKITQSYNQGKGWPTDLMLQRLIKRRFRACLKEKKNTKRVNVE